MTKTEQEYYNIVLPVVEELGYKLYDVLYVKEGADWYLRLFIDNEKGIDLEDCEKVSNAVGEKLDEVDPIENAYVLEVSSCGLERHLRDEKQFKVAIGKKIEVKLFKALEYPLANFCNIKLHGIALLAKHPMLYRNNKILLVLDSKYIL